MRASLFAFALLLGTAPLLPAVAPDAAGIEFFEQKVRPVLVKNCYGCHSVEAKKNKGGLLLDTREGVRKGGDSGPAVVPGKPDKSLLIQAVRYGELKMPPATKGQLPAAVIADLEKWVQMGAPDPREGTAIKVAASDWAEVLKERSKWWSLQRVR